MLTGKPYNRDKIGECLDCVRSQESQKHRIFEGVRSRVCSSRPRPLDRTTDLRQSATVKRKQRDEENHDANGHVSQRLCWTNRSNYTRHY